MLPFGIGSFYLVAHTMFPTTFDFPNDVKSNLKEGLTHLLHNHSSLAVCLNQLRQFKVQFLNLGNVIICPEQQCYLIFQAKQLNRIELFNPECSAQLN